ncbi:ankyrin repeat domain-containing protein [Aspergillus novofumigatus IBT 16806]|uniref:Ankyrin n=1 Tax=Aspergillus novofumigatus (strain IBT 16806) TaxID=1392255 RepID=A0A2I1CPT8_ASPN1|nr:ankyrin [Aspergillus novofumigatus IBT 16806]PKX99644.1 ankyrin [Aspergillus novofumigatus IBT 16806]
MACARIARSMPLNQTSKIIEILEGGTLFSDLLTESFRHQLEQYKILSCYEGVGDIVPFDSAVLGLPGKRETQLRINADHSNICRFDMTVQADKDNYRKVERNLQMLCADALVPKAGQIARSDVPMKNLASQGGVDLSSILLQQLDPGVISHGNLLPRSTGPRFADVPDLAWQVYQLCEQSQAAAFADAATDVSRLFIGVRSLKDRLETDTFSTDNTDKIMEVLSKCCRTLRSFQSVIDIYRNTPQRGRAHWNSNSSREEFYGMETLKADLQGSIELISTLNQDLTRRSMNDLTQRLDEVIEMLNSGDENLSSLSSQLSRASLSDVESWSDICSDLVKAGLSPSIVSEQREYIQQWLLNAVKAGRVNVDSIPDEAGQAVSYARHIEQDGHATNGGDESIMTIRNRNGSPSLRPPSDLTRRLSDSSQQLETDKTDTTTSSAPKNKRALKSWTHSLASKLRYGTFNAHDAIERAALTGDLSSMQKILASTKKLDPAWRGWDEIEILSMATDQGNIAVLSDLLALGVFASRKDQLCSCLSSAVERKDIQIMTLLFDNGAPLEAKAFAFAMTFAPEGIIERMLDRMDGDGVLDHESHAHLLLHAAAKHGHGNAFQSLVAQYGGINAAINETTPFHLACRSGNAESIQLALDLGGNVRVTDARGDSPLHAYEIGATIMLLVQNGAHLDGESGNGQTALHLAARCAHIKAMEALIQMGLDPNIQTTEGKRPLHTACNDEWVQRSVERWLPWYLKKEFNVTQFVLSPVCDMKDPRESTYYPEKVDDAIRLLLQYGASVDVRAMENVTPLHLASKSGKPSRIKILLQHGADAQAVDDWGWTPLHYAIISASQEAVDLLIPYGADLKKKVPVKMMGEHRERMDTADLLRVVNKGAFRDWERKLQLENDETTSTARK